MLVASAIFSLPQTSQPNQSSWPDHEHSRMRRLLAKTLARPPGSFSYFGSDLRPQLELPELESGARAGAERGAPLEDGPPAAPPAAGGCAAGSPGSRTQRRRVPGARFHGHPVVHAVRQDGRGRQGRRAPARVRAVLPRQRGGGRHVRECSVGGTRPSGGACGGGRGLPAAAAKELAHPRSSRRSAAESCRTCRKSRTLWTR